MTSEATAQARAAPGATTAVPEDKAREVLAQQQANDNSDDEDVLSDGAEVVDANDVTQIKENLDLDLDGQEEKVWLVRVPRFLAEIWRNPEFLQGQELGKIKINKKITGPNAPKKLILNDIPELADLPHEYKLNINKHKVENSYVFSEKIYDREANRTNRALEAQKRAEAQAAELEGDPEAVKKREEEAKMTLDQKEFQRRLRFIQRKKRRFDRYKNQDGTDKTIPFVKTIPKKTAMAGTIVHEAAIIPELRDPNYKKIIASRKQYFKEEPRPSVTLLKEHSGVSLSNTGLTMKTDTSNFLKTAEKKKSQDNRAIRMPLKDLLDLLFKLFGEYDYWSLKGLKERTKQPEVYLKESLEKIAVLLKKGPYALKYTLKKEFKELKDQERAERLGELTKTDDEEEEEQNDEDIEMEDVI